MNVENFTPMEWVRGQTIGHGSFATVSLAKPTTNCSGFPEFIAVKSCGLGHSASLMNENSILNELKGCPEIIGCFGDSVTVKDGEKLYNVALEYASGGALADKVRNLGLSVSEVRRYTNSVLKGLRFIHKNGFVHCDIKLQNVLLSGNGEVKIADFGLAKKAGTGRESKSKYEIRGTPMYMAPETVIRGEQEPASDIWALGCLVAEMVSGNPAWPCSDVGALLMKIGVGAEIPEIPGQLSEAGKDFLGKCFLKDPRQRWTAEMLLNHPFVADFHDGDTVSSKDKAKDQSLFSSPRNPFDFPDWESEQSSSMTPFSPQVIDSWFSDKPEFSSELASISLATRFRQLATDQKPNWSASSSWVIVR